MTHKKEKMKLLKQEVSRYLSAHPNDSIDWDRMKVFCVNEEQMVQMIIFPFKNQFIKDKNYFRILMIDTPFQYVMYEEFAVGAVPDNYIKTEDWSNIIHFLHKNKINMRGRDVIGGVGGHMLFGYKMNVSDKKILNLYEIPDSIKNSERVRNEIVRKRLLMEVYLSSPVGLDKYQYDYKETIFLKYDDGYIDIIPNILQCQTINKFDSIRKKYPESRIHSLNSH